jgi:hypothetical protein
MNREGSRGRKLAMDSDPGVPLADASVQQIQLELIRRRRFNDFDGPKVADSLLRHRDLWLAAHMDRFGVPHEEHPEWFPAFSLIKLRDLAGDRWNVDSLVVLTENVDRARQLAEIAKAEDWQADQLLVQENRDEIELALGMAPCEFGVLSAWWD